MNKDIMGEEILYEIPRYFQEEVEKLKLEIKRIELENKWLRKLVDNRDMQIDRLVDKIVENR